MVRKENPLFPGAALFLLFFLSQTSYGEDTEKELEGIKRKIKREKLGITKVREKEGSVLQALEKIEKEIDSRNKELKRINRRLESILIDLQKKEREGKGVDVSLQKRRKFFRRRARALYKWQRGGSPFILLNGRVSITDLMRRKRYLELMLGKDQDLLEDLSTQSARLDVLRRDLAIKKEDLDKEQKALVKVKKSIRRERKKKRDLLVRLRREKETRARVLKELEQAAHRLRKMVDEMGRKLMVKSVKPFLREGFAAVKGGLEYPVRGKVVSGYGRISHPEFPAEVFRKGIDIEAPLGEEIRAVEKGRVIFADRFSGYGKMVIIDHGERYYTIYAHLYDLMKEAGDAVEKGEPIALVGDSGSLRGSRLYFEIRKDGQPLDPLPWFGKQ